MSSHRLAQAGPGLHSARFFLAFSILVTCAVRGGAAEFPPEPPQPQRGGTFYEPPKRVDPVFLPDGPNNSQAAQRAGEGHLLRLRFAVDLPLRGRPTVARSGSVGGRAISPTAHAELHWQPLRNPLFARVSFVRYLRSDRQQPWDPDFNYSFGWEDSQPHRFSLVYNNYTGTRLNPDEARGERRFNFAEGVWTVSYRFPLPQWLEPVFLFGDGDSTACTAALNLQPRYVNASNGVYERHKGSASLGCRYTHASGLFAHFTGFAWQRDKQQPSDPDYTYGFGWDPGGDGSFALGYSNYSGNRWPGRASTEGEGGLRGGSVTFSWTRIW